MSKVGLSLPRLSIVENHIKKKVRKILKGTGRVTMTSNMHKIANKKKRELKLIIKKNGLLPASTGNNSSNEESNGRGNSMRAWANNQKASEAHARREPQKMNSS